MPTVLPTPLPKSWIATLRMLAEYYVLVRPQIQLGVFPGHKNSRYCRKVLSEMFHLRLIGKTRRKVTFDEQRTGCPVYYLQQKGVFELVKATQDETFASASTARPRDDRLEHWIASSETHRKLRLAIVGQEYVDLPVFVNEWNKYRADGRDQYFLHVMLQQQPKLSCSPDAAFLLSVHGLTTAVYLESDLGTSYEAQVVARKHMGYHRLAESGLFRTRHFPDVTDTDFRVLLVTTDRWRRDRLVRHMKNCPGASRWRFAAVQDLTPESFLHECFMVDCEGEPKFLVKPPTGYTTLGLDVRRTPKATQANRNGAVVK